MPIPRVPRALVGATLAIVLLPGCSTFRSLFPKREEVFKPIVPTLGTALVQGSDTLYALEGPGYDLLTRRRDLLFEGRSSLDRAVRSYVRYFGETPPRVRAVLIPVDPRRSARPEPDSLLRTRDSARVVLLVPAIGGRGGQSTVGTVFATPVVYEWISERYGGKAALAPPDTVNGRPLPWRDHPKLPDWVEVALPDLVAGSSRADALIARLAGQTADIMPLREMLSALRPPEVPESEPADSIAGGAAPGTAVQAAPARPEGGAARSRNARGARGWRPLAGAALFDANALSFGRFLLQREGAAFIGATADVLAGGTVTAETVLARASGNPPLSTLDAEWRAWVARQRSARPR